MSQIKYEYILCRYGELSTKGKNRRNFTNQLVRNTKDQLKQFPTLTYKETFDRLYIELHDENAQDVIKELVKVFGFTSFSLAMKLPKDIEVVSETTLNLIKEKDGKTFKVIAKRHDKTFEMISDDINRRIATEILKNTEWKVDVHNPDISILVEVRKDAIYVMMDKILGNGGYPVGIQGKAMLMLSGGIDSPVAAYLMMKRGVRLEAIHFASPPYTSNEAQQKVIDLAQKLTDYQPHIKVFVVPFTEIQLEIYKKVPESYAITIMRRFMLRIANELAHKRRCLAIANGESLGQVASQTLHSMQAITHMESLPILRPLLSFDKVEIIDIARKIDTYELSILPFEDCCTIFTPTNPTTRPHIDKILKFETQFDIESMVQKAIENIEIIDINKQTEEDMFL